MQEDPLICDICGEILAKDELAHIDDMNLCSSCFDEYEKLLSGAVKLRDSLITH